MIKVKSKFLKIKNPDTGEFEALISIKGDKGDIGGLSNITNLLGDSEELVISQKEITNIASDFNNRIGSHDAEIDGLENQVIDPAASLTLKERVSNLEISSSDQFKTLRSHDYYIEDILERLSYLEHPDMIPDV